jgi:hypothetical protein
MSSETRTLANGEVWTLRGAAWHMVDETDYAPVSAENFESYAECIAAGVARQQDVWIGRYAVRSDNE